MRIPDHAGVFLFARGRIEPNDPGGGAPLFVFFLDSKVVCGKSGDLDKMGDGDHLPLYAELLEFCSQNRCGMPADVAIDLIED